MRWVLDKNGINVLRISLLTTLLLFSSSVIIAATHYASNSGSATWAASTSISTPCSASTAFSNATAGDTVYFRGGTYTVPARSSGDTYDGYFNLVTKSGISGSPIIFQAYTGETPMLNGTTGGGGDSDYATIIGIGVKYVTIDGFSFKADSGVTMARIIIGNNDVGASCTTAAQYITVKNCTFDGGTTVIASTDNRECIRIEEASNITIQNCIIKNCRQTNDWHNTSGIKIYDSAHITVRNCEVYNCSTGIYYKRQTNFVTTSNNFIHDCSIGIFDNPGSSAYSMNDHTFNNNLILSCSPGIEVSIEDVYNATNYNFYNNTIYYCERGIDFHSSNHNAVAVNHHFYNNIIQTAATFQTAYPYGSSALQECDYNQYGTGSINIWSNCGTGQPPTSSETHYTSFSSWTASGELVGGGKPDTHGLASNPKFINTSGNMNTIADFALVSDSPCKGTGKGGADIGANISLVGTGISSVDIIPPSTPSGVTVQIIQ